MVYINDRYRFIFIENPKSGSTSIIKALEKVLNLKIHRINPQKAHLTCEQIKERFPHKWKRYLKVTTYREPFERLCSSVYFKFHQTEGKFRNINEFEKHFNNHCVYCLPQTSFTEDVDMILNLETIQQDFDQFCEKIGVKSCKLTQENSKSKNIICSKEQIKEIMISL